MIRAGLADGLGWIIAIALVAMMTIFTALAVHAITVLTGPRTEAHDDAPDRPLATPLAMRLPLAAGLAIVAALGITIWPIARLVDHAAAVLAP